MQDLTPFVPFAFVPFEISGGVNENRARFVWLGTENRLLEVPYGTIE